MKIAGRNIGSNESTYIIAEIGSNHNQNMDQAKKLIDMAYEAGADAVKFQLFDTNSLYKPGDQLYDIFKDIELNPNWIPELRDYTHSNNLGFIASPFDFKSIDVLVENGIDALKWASSETVKLDLLKYAASKKLPLIISTGMCNIADIYEAVEICKSENNEDIVLLHVTSLYPTEAADVNLKAMETLSIVFDVLVGFSDHTLDNTASIVAVSKEAKVIEKHITLDKKMKGPDHFYAQEPSEFKEFVKNIRDAEKVMGSGFVEMHPEERKVGRRLGIYIKNTYKTGHIITNEDLIVDKPALGIDKRYIDTIVGSKLTSDVSKGEALLWEHIKINN